MYLTQFTGGSEHPVVLDMEIQHYRQIAEVEQMKRAVHGDAIGLLGERKSFGRGAARAASTVALVLTLLIVSGVWVHLSAPGRIGEAVVNEGTSEGSTAPELSREMPTGVLDIPRIAPVYPASTYYLVGTQEEKAYLEQVIWGFEGVEDSSNGAAAAGTSYVFVIGTDAEEARFLEGVAEHDMLRAELGLPPSRVFDLRVSFPDE